MTNYSFFLLRNFNENMERAISIMFRTTEIEHTSTCDYVQAKKKKSGILGEQILCFFKPFSTRFPLKRCHVRILLFTGRCWICTWLGLKSQGID